MFVLFWFLLTGLPSTPAKDQSSRGAFWWQCYVDPLTTKCLLEKPVKDAQDQKELGLEKAFSVLDHTSKGLHAVLAWARQNPETQLQVINNMGGIYQQLVRLMVCCFVCMKWTRWRPTASQA